MAMGIQRKYDDHYELNFEVLQPPPKIISQDVIETTSSTEGMPVPSQKKEMTHTAPSPDPAVQSPRVEDKAIVQQDNPAEAQPATPIIQITSTDEFASDAIKTKLHIHQNIPPLRVDAEILEEEQIDIRPATEPEGIIPQETPLLKAETPRLPVEKEIKSTQAKKISEEPAPDESKTHTTPEKTMATPYTSPASSNYTRNVDRQAKEQKSLNTILSGVGLFLLVIVLIFGATAGFGGYVLWKEIQSQQVTVNRLDEKYAAAISGLDEHLVKTQEELSGVQLVIKTQRDELLTLKTQLAATSTQLRATQKESESYKERVAELERAMGIKNRTR
ncbi:MAG: hypothetical protein SGI98_12660 [Verrucomicrobiota bacterium]|nr:hypothetical protein [Verrucomicrobiota bacterium]